MITRTCDKCDKEVKDNYKNILFKVDYGNSITQDWCFKCLGSLGFHPMDHKHEESTIETLFEEFIELAKERIEE